MQEKYGFVYIWFDKKHRRYYIGSHWGNEVDGYICSSKWMRKSYRRRPDDFKRRIISRVEDRKQLLVIEGQWLSMIKKEEIGKRYYNLNTVKIGPGHWSSDERSRMSIGQKISESPNRAANISKANKGKTPKEETRKKISQSLKGQKQSEETNKKRSISLKKNWETRSRIFGLEARENMRKGQLGKKLSLEHIAARTKAQTGLKRSQETKMKMSIARKKVAEEKRLGLR